MPTLDHGRSDIAALAGVADDLAGVDQRAAELNQRITQLLMMAVVP